MHNIAYVLEAFCWKIKIGTFQCYNEIRIKGLIVGLICRNDASSCDTVNTIAEIGLTRLVTLTGNYNVR